MINLRKTIFDIKLTSYSGSEQTDEDWKQLVGKLREFCNKYHYEITELNMTLERT